MLMYPFIFDTHTHTRTHTHTHTHTNTHPSNVDVTPVMCLYWNFGLMKRMVMGSVLLYLLLESGTEVLNSTDCERLWF